jgi:hypothetical protein
MPILTAPRTPANAGVPRFRTAAGPAGCSGMRSSVACASALSPIPALGRGQDARPRPTCPLYDRWSRRKELVS